MGTRVEMFAGVFLLIGCTRAVDILNGERVGGCPSSINSSSPLTSNECQVDTDCMTNDLHKCCANGLGIKECVNPTPACRDGRKLREDDILPWTCEEQTLNQCVDRRCEDGPKAPGGWTAACCGGDAFELWPVQSPSCKNNNKPLMDSEGEYFWCGSNSVRSCPGNSECFTDTIGYRICCPSSVSQMTSTAADTTTAAFRTPDTTTAAFRTPDTTTAAFRTPDTTTVSRTSDTTTTVSRTPDTTTVASRTPDTTVASTTSAANGYPDCSTVRCADPECPDGYASRHRVETCCEYDCIPPGCIGPEGELIPRGHSYTSPSDPCVECHCQAEGHFLCSTNICERPKCDSNETLRWTNGSCCDYECVKNPIALLDTDGSLSTLCIIIIFSGALITLGIVITLITFCYYKRKNHKDNSHLDSDYRNLTYSTPKEQKSAEKLENIYETLGTVKMDQCASNEFNSKD